VHSERGERKESTHLGNHNASGLHTKILVSIQEQFHSYVKGAISVCNIAERVLSQLGRIITQAILNFFAYYLTSLKNIIFSVGLYKVTQYYIFV
jgi:hypothetical protein